jgi:hypothetical protein
MPYIPGDYYQICDVCGFKKRASRMRRRWDGAMVCDADFEERHPQELNRYRGADKQSVPVARPEPEDYFCAENEITRDDL